MEKLQGTEEERVEVESDRGNVERESEGESTKDVESVWRDGGSSLEISMTINCSVTVVLIKVHCRVFFSCFTLLLLVCVCVCLILGYIFVCVYTCMPYSACNASIYERVCLCTLTQYTVAGYLRYGIKYVLRSRQDGEGDTRCQLD